MPDPNQLWENYYLLKHLKNAQFELELLQSTINQPKRLMSKPPQKQPLTDLDVKLHRALCYGLTLNQYLSIVKGQSMSAFPTPDANSPTAQLTENQLQRRVKLGVVLSRQVGLRDKVQLIRGIENQWDNTVEQFIQDAAQVWATIHNKTHLLNRNTLEWDWTEFFEFLKWLIPLLLELFA